MVLTFCIGLSRRVSEGHLGTGLEGHLRTSLGPGLEVDSEVNLRPILDPF